MRSLPAFTGGRHSTGKSCENAHSLPIEKDKLRQGRSIVTAIGPEQECISVKRKGMLLLLVGVAALFVLRQGSCVPASCLPKSRWQPVEPARLPQTSPTGVSAGR